MHGISIPNVNKNCPSHISVPKDLSVTGNVHDGALGATSEALTGRMNAVPRVLRNVSGKGSFPFGRVGSGAWRLLLIMTGTSLLLVSGCASLPDVNRIQNNMDAMVHYMGVMAGSMPLMVNSTARMAETAERMERKSDALLNSLQKKGGTAERTIQNYSQALLDNERSMINSLKGIRGELGDLKLSLTSAARAPQSVDQQRVNAEIMSKLSSLENRLSTLASKMEKVDTQTSR